MTLSASARVAIAVMLAAGSAFLVTPLAARVARHFEFYDRPKGYKGHARPTPYLGGTAVFTAFAMALFAAARDRDSSLLLISAAALLVVVGTIDDRHMVSPLVRVVCELGLGFGLSALDLGWRLGAGGLVDALVMGIWIVGVVNAFNLFDNMDGASSSLALVCSAGVCALSLVIGSTWVAVGSAALCGACLGFLPHNLCKPAKIFLGDGGSMPLGFAVAVLTANAARGTEPGLLGLLVGCLLVGVPALDTTLVIVSRTRRGISILTGGRDHLTHRTRLRMKTALRVALTLGAAQAVISAAVIGASQAGSPELVYILLAFVTLAVAAIIALEEAIPLEREQAATVDRRHSRSAWQISTSPWTRHGSAVLLGVIGLGAGLSPLFSAYYIPGVWIVLGLIFMVLAAMATVARPPRLSLAAGLLLSGLGALGLWSLLSMTWAQATEQATLSGNLWLSYAALTLLLIIVVRGRRDAVVLLGGVGLGITIVAVSVLVRLLGSDPTILFIAGRINSPLGYINGEGCVFAMGVWLALALAERRRVALAGLGMLLTVIMAGLAVLSESRGAAIATAVAVVVALAVIPGRRRRVMAIIVAAGAFAFAVGSLLAIYRAGNSGAVPAATAHHAVLLLLLGAVGAAAVWAAAVAVANVADAGRAAGTNAGFMLMRRAATAVAIAAVVIPLGIAVAKAPQLERTVRQQWHAFVHLGVNEGGTSTQTRLFTGSGNRYDYWRVAWHVFTDHPVVGVGAGNFPAYYFRDRRTQETIQNPHSLELQSLSELGVIGLLALLTAVAGIMVGIRRLVPVAGDSRATRGVLVAGAGTTVVWLVDASGDWMHLLPGVTAMALCAMTALVADTGRAPADVAAAPMARPKLGGLLGAAAVIFVLAVGGASLLRDGLARHYVSEAHRALASDPNGAIAAADRALGLDPAELDAYYVKAAGQARFDRAGAARVTLLQAAHQDPTEFVTWTLLGDLEVRAGDVTAAHRYYRHALGLDPLEPALRQLASESPAALRQAAR